MCAVSDNAKINCRCDSISSIAKVTRSEFSQLLTLTITTLLLFVHNKNTQIKMLDAIWMIENELK